jgi:hypothetical protein
VASPLENLSGPGRPLQKEPPDAKEFAGLKRSALARLTEFREERLVADLIAACRSVAAKLDLLVPISPVVRP